MASIEFSVAGNAARSGVGWFQRHRISDMVFLLYPSPSSVSLQFSNSDISLEKKIT